MKRKTAFARLVKHFRSDSTCHCEVQEDSLSSIRRGIKGEVITLLKPNNKIKGFQKKKDNTSSPTLPLNEGKGAAAFTLAETLITLTVIGIIAVITVPAIISKHTESANRTKIKKAMSVYDTAINKMVIENGIKDNTALVSVAGDENNNCAGSSTYFKMTQGSGCEFKTSDGLWWNIEDITHPIVAFKQADLTAEKAAGDSKEAFYFVGRIDETTGILRVNDYIAEAEPNKGYLTKLYNFVKPEVGGAGGGDEPAAPAFCSGNDLCTSLTWNEFTIGEGEGRTYTQVSTPWGQNMTFCNWDPEKETCTATNSTAAEGSLYISEPLTLNDSDAKSTDNCAESRNKSLCESNGDYWTLARRQCEKAGGRLPTGAELQVMNSKGQLPSDGYYWTAETFPIQNDGAFILQPGSGGGSFITGFIGDSNGKAVCVGN